MRSSVLALGALLLALPVTARAHFTLVAPPPASTSTNGGKGDPPCGPTAMPSNAVTAVTGGSKLTIKLNETVFHPGFYRVALSIKSRDELPLDNVVKDASGKILPPAGPGNSATAVYEENPVFPVLADNFFAHTTDMKTFTGEVTLPNVNCDKCTLQVIEFMASHGPDYFYRHCADLKITADPSKPVFDPTAGSGSGGSSSGGGAGIGGAAGGTGGVGAASGSAAVTAGSGGVGGTSTPPGVGGAGSAGTSAGAPPVTAGTGNGSASAGAAASAAGAMGTPTTDDGAESGGCALSNRVADPRPLLLGLLGLLVLVRRRNRRH